MLSERKQLLKNLLNELKSGDWQVLDNGASCKDVQLRKDDWILYYSEAKYSIGFYPAKTVHSTACGMDAQVSIELDGWLGVRIDRQLRKLTKEGARKREQQQELQNYANAQRILDQLTVKRSDLINVQE